MSEVKRWTETTSASKGASVLNQMQPTEWGMWVLYTDHAEAMREKDLEIDRLRKENQVPEDFDPNDPSWNNVDPAIAFHLIERHADSWADVGAMMDAWRNACGNARAERAEAQRDALLAAAKLVANLRHTCSMQNSNDGETCSTCGSNWRDTSKHFRPGESSLSDMAALRAAIASAEKGDATLDAKGHGYNLPATNTGD